MYYYRVLIYNDVSQSGGFPGWAHSTYGLYDMDKWAMKTEGQARLELPGNPGGASLELCMCATGCRVHMVRGDEQSKGTSGGQGDEANPCFGACMLLCFLVAALHP